VFDPPEIIVRWSRKAEDVLKKIDGEWLFAKRQVTLNHDAAGPHVRCDEPLHADQE
jgi:hypothetical protein